MPKIVHCSEYTCFQNSGGCRCNILNEPYKNKKCPFMKTDAEVDDGRMRAHKSLLDREMYELIQKYEYNPQRRW